MSEQSGFIKRKFPQRVWIVLPIVVFALVIHWGMWADPSCVCEELSANFSYVGGRTTSTASSLSARESASVMQAVALKL